MLAWSDSDPIDCLRNKNNNQKYRDFQKSAVKSQNKSQTSHQQEREPLLKKISCDYHP
ncbi:hypothetical protein BRLA_c005650 [Brevibacillus laterosporus LMG 15441]|uniref:Uncharacterized protein n=1 Tax=Brevibacillus laterosporus LMG 15441 TaxID=1042163 RepID=A0A075R149_BRELA|nr:hypothetical protein BRLA_c005650 [Brevibacillus laterosporus LMG 15441]ERM16646.1 hypothetical protein P615_22620 [Brevibacillus laterosporus PE36]